VDFYWNFLYSGDEQIWTRLVVDEWWNYVWKTLKELDEVNKAAPASAQHSTPADSTGAGNSPTTAPTNSTTEQVWSNLIHIKHKWIENQILTYKENFDYKNYTKADIIWILEKYKDADFSKKENIPENSGLIIFAIQWAIKELGKWAKLGNIDGQFWTKTGEALNELQKDILWFTWKDVDGLPWPKTIQAIIEKLNAST
jgi:hypothetical protein